MLEGEPILVHWQHFSVRTVTLDDRWRILVIVISVGFPAFAVPNATAADAPAPILRGGDQWKYNFTGTIFPATIQGLLIERIEAEEAIVVQGKTYDSYKSSFSMSGTISALGTGGLLTASGTGYLSKPDLAFAKSTSTLSLSLGSMSFTRDTEVRDDPPFRSYDFPLSEGKTWTDVTNETRNATEIDGSTGEVTTTTDTNTVTRTARVTHIETVTVAAGTFETFVISHISSSSFGFKHTNATSVQEFYSPQVGNTVKATIFGPGSTLNLELLEVKASPYEANPPNTPTNPPKTNPPNTPAAELSTNPYWLAMVAGSLIVVLAVIFLVARRTKSTSQAPAPVEPMTSDTPAIPPAQSSWFP